MNRSRLMSAAVGLGLLAGSPMIATPAQAAEPTAKMTLSPVTKTVKRGATFPLTVTVNTGGQPVNAVQFYINLPDTRLDCSSITLIPDGWPNQASIKCDTATAALAVYSTPGGPPFNGTAKVATIRLKATNVLGKATVAFDRTKTLVASSQDNTDILTTTNKSVITVTN